MFKPILTGILIAITSTYTLASTRFDELCDSSDLLWCDEENCALYRSGDTFKREYDMPVGFTITVNDDSFKEDELRLYMDDLFVWWDDYMAKNAEE